MDADHTLQERAHPALVHSGGDFRLIPECGKSRRSDFQSFLFKVYLYLSILAMYPLA
jgi:hypothetical protein